MGEELTLVARKACFGLPTACPSCLPVYIYLKFAQLPFNLEFNLIHPDSDEIPYVESGTYVAFNNEKSGVIESLKEDGVVNLDANVNSNPEWISTKAMIDSWLADALLYELWVGTDGSSAKQIYYSDIAWPIGKFLFFHQVHIVKQRLGITKENADKREEEIYKKATLAYGALSSSLGDQSFFFENRPTSLDANFLGHAIFTIEALPAASVLRNKLLEHSNLVQYASKLRTDFLNGETTSATPSSSSFPRPAATSTSSSKPKSKPKKEKTEEEKKFRRRAKYFLVTQLVAVLVFMSLLGGSDEAELDLEDDGGLAYD